MPKYTESRRSLVARYPRAVKAVDAWNNGTPLGSADEFTFSNNVRAYAARNNVGSPWLQGVEALLGAIEMKAAEEPLSDEEIEAMKWSVDGSWLKGGRDFAYSCGLPRNAEYIAAAQHACIDVLLAEIKRVRGASTNG